MEIPSTAVYITIEIFAALVLLSGVLIFYIILQRKTQKALRQNIVTLNQSIQKLKTAAKKATLAVSPKEIYQLAIKQQLDHTRSRHDSLKSDSDISMDISMSSPPDCQTAAVRNAFLVAERESAANSKDGKPDWGILGERIQRLIQFFKLEIADSARAQNADSQAKVKAEKKAAKQHNIAKDKDIAHLQQELETATTQVKELEKIKNLFVELEERWLETKEQVAEYYKQLIEMVSQTSDPTSFEFLLTSYQDAFVALEAVLTQSGDGKIASGVVINAEERVNRFIEPLNKSIHEVHQLKVIAEEQRQTIVDLRKQLAQAKSAEEKAGCADSLAKKLGQYQKSLDTMDACAQMLEEQLEHSKQDSISVANQLEKMRQNITKIPKLEELVKAYSEESKVILRDIAELEYEGNKLQQQMENSTASPEQLKELQNKLLALHIQHTELEERYLALKDKSQAK